MNAILHQDRIPAPGTGQGCKLHWQTTADGATSSDPGRQQTVPVPTGNSANAATVAALRARKVLLSCPHFGPPGLMSI